MERDAVHEIARICPRFAERSGIDIRGKRAGIEDFP
jgi:hypothetical protein